MSKAIRKPRCAANEVPAKLSAADLAGMMQMDAECRAAASALEAADLRAQLEQVRAELEAQKLVLKAQADKALGDRAVAQQRAELEAKKSEQRAFAASLANRYAVDWRSASFDPMTGQIVRLP